MNTKFFAHKYDNTGRFHNIFSYPEIVRTCGKGDVFEIEVRPVAPGEVSPYWGWHDFKRDEYCMIWASRVQAEMCFTYGYEIEERHGRGKLMNFVVAEVRRVEEA